MAGLAHVKYNAVNTKHTFKQLIKGPDNTTCQLLPIVPNRCGSGMGKARTTKEMVEDRLCATVVCESEVCESVVCERAVWDNLCVTELFVEELRVKELCV